MSAVQRFNNRAGLMNPEANGLYVRYEDHIAALSSYRTHLSALHADMLAAIEAQPKGVTDEMVNRFLGWRLPDDFSPDCGISFKALGHPNCWPVGTNLLSADQARAMFTYVLAPTLAEPAQQEGLK